MGLGDKQIGEGLQKLAEGLKANPPAGLQALGVNGASVTVSDLAVTLLAKAGLQNDVVAAEKALDVALAAREAGAHDARALYNGVVKALKGVLGPRNPLLSNYGIAPEKEATPLTAEQLVNRNEKSAATRLARGTKGKKQKAAIHGVVPAPTPEPSASTSTPAATAKT